MSDLVVLWALFLVVAAAGAAYRLRGRPALFEPRPTAVRRPRPERVWPMLDHADFSEETLPAVLSTPMEWDEP
jgi:hypothetical protein